jgi:hypothetical protein
MPLRPFTKAFWLVPVLALNAYGEIHVSLPLEGYYRPGRFMPLHINLQGQKSPITFRASNALLTVFNFK